VPSDTEQLVSLEEHLHANTGILITTDFSVCAHCPHGAVVTETNLFVSSRVKILVCTIRLYAATVSPQLNVRLCAGLSFALLKAVLD